MKKIFSFFIVLFAVAVVANAQTQLPPASMPDAELTEEQADLRIQQFQSNVKALEEKLSELNTKIDNLKSKLDETNAKLDECDDEIKKLLGVSDEDISAFAQKLGVLEGKVREMQRLSDVQLLERQDEVKQLDEELNELKGNKISLLPQFYDRIVKLGRDIKGLYREKKITTYTVGTWAEDRDCLWNIAGKIDIYSDPFMWPKIWMANTDEIRNPDIIFPGQVLQIPVKGPKTDEEMKAERKYWREKKEAQAEMGDATPGAEGE